MQKYGWYFPRAYPQARPSAAEERPGPPRVAQRVAQRPVELSDSDEDNGAGLLAAGPSNPAGPPLQQVPLPQELELPDVGNQDAGPDDEDDELYPPSSEDEEVQGLGWGRQQALPATFAHAEPFVQGPGPAYATATVAQVVAALIQIQQQHNGSHEIMEAVYAVIRDLVVPDVSVSSWDKIKAALAGATSQATMIHHRYCSVSDYH